MAMPIRRASRCARRASRPSASAWSWPKAPTSSRPGPHAYAPPPSLEVRQKGKQASGIGVVMAKGANILELGPAVASATAQFMASVPHGFDLEQIADQPAVVDHAVGEFVHSFIEALAIV